jgi:hypothetical protein
MMCWDGASTKADSLNRYDTIKAATVSWSPAGVLFFSRQTTQKKSYVMMMAMTIIIL